MNINYQKTQKDLLKNLPKRTVDVIERRFGLGREKRETLEFIGEGYGVCRERIRQIEETGISFIKKEIKGPLYQGIFQVFTKELKKTGDLKKEDAMLSQLPPEDTRNQTFF